MRRILKRFQECDLLLYGTSVDHIAEIDGSVFLWTRNRSWHKVDFTIHPNGWVIWKTIAENYVEMNDLETLVTFGIHRNNIEDLFKMNNIPVV